MLFSVLFFCRSGPCELLHTIITSNKDVCPFFPSSLRFGQAFAPLFKRADKDALKIKSRSLNAFLTLCVLNNIFIVFVFSTEGSLNLLEVLIFESFFCKTERILEIFMQRRVKRYIVGNFLPLRGIKPVREKKNKITLPCNLHVEI